MCSVLVLPFAVTSSSSAGHRGGGGDHGRRGDVHRTCA